jgi:hypothetical protein
MMRKFAFVFVSMIALDICSTQVAHAQVRAKADLTCASAGEMLQYDCVIKLTNSRTGEPISGVTLAVGADMPSMPGIHNVRPVKATEEAEKGTYKARIVLEMHGDWAVRLDLSGAVRDRVIAMLRFEGDHVTDASHSPGRR